MTRHRREPAGRRRADPPGRRRAPRPGRRRAAPIHRGRAAIASLSLTAVAGLGLVVVDTRDPAAEVAEVADRAAAVPAPSTPTATPRAKRAPAALSRASGPRADTLPAASGEGRRVVYSEGRQRVWLVRDDGSVARTYLVSGSIYDNLDPGTYSVYSRSEKAWGIDDSGTMELFVRFTRGERAAIGFHTIPVDDGKPLQTVEQLGTPLSHGCIRQRRSDAVALWEFAPIGTTVVVTE